MAESDSFRRLVADAILAPSSHNTQPWRFCFDGAKVALYADRLRALPVNDPHDRELTVSCGAALFNLRVSAAALGIGAETAILPAPADPDLLARVALDPAGPGNAVLAGLHPAITLRRTWRKPFDARPVAAAAVAALRSAAADEGATLVVLDTADRRQELCALIGEADALLWDDPSWRRELAAWMHPRRQGDGLTVPTLAAPIAQAIVRTFDLGNGVAARDREIAEHSPVLAVLCTATDDPAHWLAAGQALQRLLLRAVQSGLQASYFNQPMAVPLLRDRLRAALGLPGMPQIVLRIGHANGAVPPSPRRALEDVVEVV